MQSFYTSEQLKEMQSEVVRSVCSQLGLPEYAARALLSSYGMLVVYSTCWLLQQC